MSQNSHKNRLILKSKKSKKLSKFPIVNRIRKNPDIAHFRDENGKLTRHWEVTFI